MYGVVSMKYVLCDICFIQGTELWRCINDSNVVLGRAPGPQTDGLVRSTLQVRGVVNHCRTLAAL
jgi:hypothetical protein